MLARISGAFFAGLFCLVFSGCGDGLSSLQGTVLIDGQPAPKGVSLKFSPLTAGGSSSYASTDETGKYEASFTFQTTGIQAGEHSVSLVPGGGAIGESRMPVIGPDGKPVAAEEKAPVRFPESYYQEIQKLTVQPGANLIDIELSTEPAPG